MVPLKKKKNTKNKMRVLKPLSLKEPEQVGLD